MILRQDSDYSDGTVLGSMCTEPHPVAAEAFAAGLHVNLGDPYLFPNAYRAERECIGWIADTLLDHPAPEEAEGSVVSGGTEANILAAYAAREVTGGREIVVPATRHFSFEKAARMLRMKLVEAPSRPDYTVDVDAVQDLISRDTALIVGIVGTTETGSVDDIEALSDVAEDHGIPLHVDAAFGGFTAPFLREKYPLPRFGFDLEAVVSVTVDPHKMGLVPPPAGGIVFRDDEFPKAIEVYAPYLSGGGASQYTITGTRPGAPVLALYANILELGEEGYREIAFRCYEETLKVVERARELGLKLTVDPPHLNLVNIRLPDRETAELLLREAEREGWKISISTKPLGVRVVMMPHLDAETVSQFLELVARVLDG
ncbi:tyrosine decarboxylase MfnA [Methanopyrus sp.]